MKHILFATACAALVLTGCHSMDTSTTGTATNTSNTNAPPTLDVENINNPANTPIINQESTGIPTGSGIDNPSSSSTAPMP